MALSEAIALTAGMPHKMIEGLQNDSHDDLNKEVGVQWLRRGWQSDSAIGLTSPKAPAELHLFDNTYYAERINVRSPGI